MKQAQWTPVCPISTLPNTLNGRMRLTRELVVEAFAGRRSLSTLIASPAWFVGAGSTFALPPPDIGVPCSRLLVLPGWCRRQTDTAHPHCTWKIRNMNTVLSGLSRSSTHTRSVQQLITHCRFRSVPSAWCSGSASHTRCNAPLTIRSCSERFIRGWSNTGVRTKTTRLWNVKAGGRPQHTIGAIDTRACAVGVHMSVHEHISKHTKHGNMRRTYTAGTRGK